MNFFENRIKIKLLFFCFFNIFVFNLQSAPFSPWQGDKSLWEPQENYRPNQCALFSLANWIALNSLDKNGSFEDRARKIVKNLNNNILPAVLAREENAPLKRAYEEPSNNFFIGGELLQKVIDVACVEEKKPLIIEDRYLIFFTKCVELFFEEQQSFGPSFESFWSKLEKKKLNEIISKIHLDETSSDVFTRIQVAFDTDESSFENMYIHLGNSDVNFSILIKNFFKNLFLEKKASCLVNKTASVSRSNQSGEEISHEQGVHFVLFDIDLTRQNEDWIIVRDSDLQHTGRDLFQSSLVQTLKLFLLKLSSYFENREEQVLRSKQINKKPLVDSKTSRKKREFFAESVWPGFQEVSIILSQ